MDTVERAFAVMTMTGVLVLVGGLAWLVSFEVDRNVAQWGELAPGIGCTPARCGLRGLQCLTALGPLHRRSDCHALDSAKRQPISFVGD
jgi:hypothetical protein